MMFFSYAVLMSAFGKYIRFCLINRMLDFSFLRVEYSVKEHVQSFHIDNKVISSEIKKGMKAH